MKKLLLIIELFFTQMILLAICLCITGCGTSKPIPDWLNSSYTQLENYKKSYLGGKDKIAAIQFKAAINEIKKSGDLEFLSRAYLIRMALQTASLENMDDEEYLKINALQPSRHNSSYYALLRGEIDKVDDNLLPRQYGALFTVLKRGAGVAAYLQEVEKMEEPVSQLIALGIIVRLYPDNESALKKAVETASVQGWKKVMVAYLEKLITYYEGKNEVDKALAVRERVNLIRD